MARSEKPNVALPSLRQLRHLVALADARHFGRAAEAAHVSPSALSDSIKELERLLDATLVDRGKRRVALTPIGEGTVERARQLIADAEALTRAAAATKAPLTGALRLGVIPTVAPFLLPPVLPGLRRAYPALRLFLTEDLTGNLVRLLHEGRLDLLLLALPYDAGAVETETLFEDPFLLTLPRGHALAKLDRVPAARIPADELLLLRDGHCLTDHALAACRLSGRRAAAEFEATSLHTLVQMVANGLGVTLLPVMAVRAGLLRGTGLVAKPVEDPGAVREIGLMWRRGAAAAAECRLLGREIAQRWRARSVD
jgi:LysR family hydrogen peroxide-inducible transcriptional activator